MLDPPSPSPFSFSLNPQFSISPSPHHSLPPCLSLSQKNFAMVDLQGNCALKPRLFLSLYHAFSRVYQRIQWGYAFTIILQARTVI